MKAAANTLSQTYDEFYFLVLKNQEQVYVDLVLWVQLDPLCPPPINKSSRDPDPPWQIELESLIKATLHRWIFSFKTAADCLNTNPYDSIPPLILAIESEFLRVKRVLVRKASQYRPPGEPVITTPPEPPTLPPHIKDLDDRIAAMDATRQWFEKIKAERPELFNDPQYAPKLKSLEQQLNNSVMGRVPRWKEDR